MAFQSLGLSGLTITSYGTEIGFACDGPSCASPTVGGATVLPGALPLAALGPGALIVAGRRRG